MSEEQGKYETETDEVREAMEMLGKGYNTSDPAAIIHPPKTVNALSEKGLIEYRVWGWVKVSANFIHHIRKLKGAKLAIWQVIALAIDENGKCSLTIKQICALSGYSHTEVIDSIKELEEWGYLSVKKDGKGRLYTPEFAARGENSPGKRVKKLESLLAQEGNDSSPQEGNDSSPQEGNSDAIPLRVLRVKDGADTPDTSEFPIDWQVGLGQPLTTITEEELFKKQARDAANLIEQGCAGGGELAYAFMVTRGMLIPESKAKGQRKAAREMLGMKVKAKHVVEATKQLMEARDKRGNPLTVVDLFSVQDTAVGIANQPVIGDPDYVRPEFKPVQEKKGNFVPPPASLRKPRPVSG